MVVGVAGLLLSTVFIIYKKNQCNTHHETNLEMKIDVNDDQDNSRKNIPDVNSEFCCIMQNTD